jgi:tetratricopeptide (TPR) repeat protein
MAYRIEPHHAGTVAWLLVLAGLSATLAAAAADEQASVDRVRYAMDLAQRGAVCSARAEFRNVLASIAAARDAGQPAAPYSTAFREGWKAIREADDFAPLGPQADVQLDLKRIVAAHATTVLADAHLDGMTPLDALQTYYAYAAGRLAFAAGHDSAASLALYGWGRLEIACPTTAKNGSGLGAARAIALERAALAVDPANHLAANELGVLLARYGQLAEARQLLVQSVSAAPTAETWYNLSIVYAKLGQERESCRAYEHYRALAGNVRTALDEGAKIGRASTIRWVQPAVFMRESGPDPLGSLASKPESPQKPPSAATSVPPAGTSASPWPAWLKPKTFSRETQ